MLSAYAQTHSRNKENSSHTTVATVQGRFQTIQFCVLVYGWFKRWSRCWMPVFIVHDDTDGACGRVRARYMSMYSNSSSQGNSHLTFDDKIYTRSETVEVTMRQDGFMRLSSFPNAFPMLQMDRMKWIYCNWHNGNNAPMLHNRIFKMMLHHKPNTRHLWIVWQFMCGFRLPYDQHRRTPLTGYHWTHTTEFIDVDSRNKVHLHTVCLAVEFFSVQ